MRWLALQLLLASASPLAYADDPGGGVRPRHSVEVLDDQAKIDDVISRMRQHPSPPPVEQKAPPEKIQGVRPHAPEHPKADGKKVDADDKAKAQERWRREHEHGGADRPAHRHR
jgi:hypothetical protein